MGIDLYVGGHAGSLPARDGTKEPDSLGGLRMFTAAHNPNRCSFFCELVAGRLDSGAFTDVIGNKRLIPDQALDRQLAWEKKASDKWGQDWISESLVSYDRLIDEVWTGSERKKRRWSIAQADYAVYETIIAAKYLANQRDELKPRRLILSAQGVDAIQYTECLEEILKVAKPEDIIGFGGWCILGLFTTWLPEFWRTLYATFPLISQAGIKDVHIFGVLYQPALGGMLWMADQYNLRISTDSTAPIMAALGNSRKAGCRAASGYWRDNVRWWQDTLANLRQSEYYKQPPQLDLCRQLELF